MSGILHKAENAILGHQQERVENQLEDSGKSCIHQPHGSKLANKIDPRIHDHNNGHQDFDFDSEPSGSMRTSIRDRTKTGDNSQKPYTEDNMVDESKGPYNTNVADEFEQRVISEDQGRPLEDVKIARPTKQDRLVGA
ncbi:Collagen alpha-5(VI) chain [Penicillium malachiteum]|uniref:Collagen alpha-5(VI) chain n=1 Tax=Penicillium malachiteum TaxID=1324776 RepID=UPI0025497960|nr:Collagen alpha-5(VI) chain [Penicillium malachiteum]KAJ5714783.1 Collagen alpha-5(VI) chain [Penicillium malachiteum]